MLCVILCCAGLLSGDLIAGDVPDPSAASPAGKAPADWKFTASAYAYFPPDDDDYVQPTFTADRQWLHLEGRYNYEDQNTVSTWLGYNFSWGKEVTFDLTPMLGGVFGDTSGIAPGYHAAFNWRWLDLYTEGEHVFSTDGETGSFFYSWSTVTASPVKWLQLGLVAQHTRAYESEREIQRGVLIGFSGRNVAIIAHMFNPDDDDPTYVLALNVNW